MPKGKNSHFSLNQLGNLFIFKCKSKKKKIYEQDFFLFLQNQNIFQKVRKNKTKELTKAFDFKKEQLSFKVQKWHFDGQKNTKKRIDSNENKKVKHYLFETLLFYGDNVLR